MTSDAQMRCQSLESSILFMQQEHASTLKGLHEEIHKLQKRCSELTFQLAMEATSLPQDDNLMEKLSSTEKRLGITDAELEDHKAQLEKKDKKIKMLEEQIKAQGKKYTDEIKHKNQIVAHLKAEIESKSSNIAYLTTQLHALKVKAQDKLARSTDPSQMVYGPSPPKEAIPKSGRRRMSRKLSAESSHPVLTSSVKVRAASGRKLPDKPDTPEKIPDPAPFLTRESQVRTTGQMVLPPIGKSLDESAASFPVPPMKRDSNMFIKRKQTQDSSMSPEVEVLAVEGVHMQHKKDSSLRRAHEYTSNSPAD